MNANEVGDTLTSIGKVREKLPTEVLGPCLVSIGLPLVNRIKFMASRIEWSPHKTKYVFYPMHLFNGNRVIGIIGIEQYFEPHMINPAVELRDFVEPKLRGLLHRAVTYEINNGAGAVTIGTGLSGPRASFTCKINDVTWFSGFLNLQQEDALKLIYSMRVELSEKPTQKKEAEPTEIDLVPKLTQLSKAFDAGLISEDEYLEKKKEIISKM